MAPHQPGILAPLPAVARYLTFHLRPDADPLPTLTALAGRPHDDDAVVGLGAALLQRVGATIPGVREMPPLTGPGIAIPSTPAALWCWVRGNDRGDVLHASRAWLELLGDAFDCVSLVDAFVHDGGRDLTGYEDGTENPKGDDAVTAAFLQGVGDGLDGGSFVAVQQWEHDLDHFGQLDPETRDHIVGRRRSDNEELDDAPASAHVKRTAQESFEPEAFVLRRSMPWADANGEGLVFVAFGRSFDAFEAQLRRMVGEEDGITDGLFRFTKPITGSYFWCPPVAHGQLDLSAAGITPNVEA